jgi:DNA-binding MarR family transcriptional regulator
MAAVQSARGTGPNLLYAINQVELAVRAQLDEVLRPTGVSVPQYIALTVLERRDGLTSAALARRSFVTAQTMGDLVTALERRELIVRHPDPTHRKRLTIVLTDTGRRFLADVSEDVAAVERRMTTGVPAEGQEALRELLRSFLRNLSERPDQTGPGSDDGPAGTAGTTRQPALA